MNSLMSCTRNIKLSVQPVAGELDTNTEDEETDSLALTQGNKIHPAALLELTN